MIKIGSINSQHLTQALHLQFVTDTRGLVRKFDPAALKIVPQYEVFSAKVDQEDSCYKIVQKSDLSESKKDADEARGSIITGINEYVKANLRHFDPTVCEAAKRLKILLDAYNMPTPLIELPYDAETAAAANLIQEFEGKYAADVQTTGLTTWVAQLRERNNAFDRLAKAYNEQKAAKPPVRMKDARNETDAAYKDIVLVVNALIVMEGATAYAPFVTEQNELIKHYNDLIAQHRGRNKAKQSKNEPKTDMPMEEEQNEQ
jgi:hypothetical protein